MLEGQLGHLVAEFNIVKEEELQSQEMVIRQYMINEYGPSNSYCEHVQATTFESKEVVKETVNEPSLEYHVEACLAQCGDDLDLDMLLEQADAILDPTFELQTEKGETTEISFPNSSSLAIEPFIVDNHSSMPSSYNRLPQVSLVQHFSTAHFDNLEERVNQLMAARHAQTQLSHTYIPHQSYSYCYHPSHRIDDYPFFNHYVIEANKSAHEPAQTTTIVVSEKKVVSKAEEKDKQIEPPPISNLSNEKEVSTETHSFITIPLERHHKSQVSPFQCLKEPSYVEIFKESRMQRCKFRKRSSKKILLSNKVCYIRWRNILQEGYIVLMKKEWKRLVGHSNDWGKHCKISSPF